MINHYLEDSSNFLDSGSKGVIAVVSIIFLIMFGLNCLTPLIFGDDYVYKFVWQYQQTMNTPFPETARRITSFSDIMLSQWNHYFSWSGRSVAHIIVQFFAWKGKFLFNFFNAIVFIILVLQISWIANGGECSLKTLKSDIICLIFFYFWAFTAGFNIVFLWIPGACNYVWTMMILLLFLMIYTYKYYHLSSLINMSQRFSFGLFLLGIIAGWTNENTVCWVILFLGFWLYQLYKVNRLEKWMIFGFSGLCIGYYLLIFAPGNMARAVEITGHSLIYMSWDYLKRRLAMFCIIELFQLVLWFYIFTALIRIKRSKVINTFVLRSIILAKVFCLLSFLSNVIMLFAPDFQQRSGFPSLVFLIIAVLLFIHIERLSGINFVDYNVKRFLKIVGTCYFLVTVSTTFWGLNCINEYTTSVIEMAQVSNKGHVLEIPSAPKISKSLWYVTGLHLLFNELSDNENNTKNLSFSRYYGIKGIRVVKAHENHE